MTRLFAELTYEEAASALARGIHALLPVGAVEAHGPHLPLSTDVVISETAALRAAEVLHAEGVEAYVLPPVVYTVADYASEFAGTLSLPSDVVKQYVVGVLDAASRAGFRRVVVCNAHFDPANIAVLREATEKACANGGPVVFPDVTRKPHALRLGDEFRTGACHAGRYETSLVLAAAPSLVHEKIAHGLVPNPSSLSVAIREGRTTFRAAGGDRAFFGWPADATREEGNALYSVLADIFAAAVRDSSSV